MRSGEEIQAALRAFVTRWNDYTGTERGGAQTYLAELITCYGSDWRDDLGGTFEDAHTSSSAGIMDLHLPGVAIVEMKAPREAPYLAIHRDQALRYWRHSADAATDRPAPPYVVLCAFQRFEVWEPGRFPTEPRAEFTLEDLPQEYEKLIFLAGRGHEPLFGPSYQALTTEAARLMAELYHGLRDRTAAAPEDCQRFVLQMVWCLFAEDLGMLSGHPVQRILSRLAEDPSRSSYAELGALFDVLNDPSDYGRAGDLAGTQYVNGALFARPAKVHLNAAERDLLVQAARFDWRRVNPTIFGSLMESVLGRDLRWKLGAHYTHEVDIMRIVRPTVLEPWRARMQSAQGPHQLEEVLADLCRFVVLDPACGCGNFLYVAYRELRSLEHELKEQIAQSYAAAGLDRPDRELPSYPIDNLRGIDIEPGVVLIARVTLWMGHKQVADRYGVAENPLPLVDLSGIQVGDALAMPWPAADVIIGNPPFLGSQHLRGARGDAYIKWLQDAFGVGVKDYCVYWFRKAHDHLRPGQRAGLVGTNSVSQNRARGASLDYVVAHGGVLTEAVSTQKWPGEAKVHVSLVNWVKRPATPPTGFILDGTAVSGISAELRSTERSTGDVARLPANRGRCFQGPIPVGDGFIVSAEEAAALHARTDADYRAVVRPYLIGEDIAQDPRQHPRRWVIDFAQLPLERAMRWPAALALIEQRVRPVRQRNNRRAYREHWWIFGEARPGMRRALQRLSRFVAANRVGKRLLFTWQEPWTLPSDKAVTFVFDDDYAMGVLSSCAHSRWAWARSSTLKADLNYTPTTAFETFPWPYPVTDDQRSRVAEASRRVIARRQEICAAGEFGLTRLYNLVDDGAYTDLERLHRELDEAIVAAYGWPRSVARDADELVSRLLARNRDIASGERDYDPFGDAPPSTSTLGAIR